MCPDCSFEPHGQICDRPGCERTGCDPCSEERWFAAHPVEAAERDYEDAEAEALRAEEGGFEDWRELGREAEWAWQRWQDLVEDQAGQGRAAAP